MRTKAGFTLMETLAAVAILAVAMIPLIVLQRDLARAQVRAEAALIRAEEEKAALQALEGINPFAQGAGELELGTTRLEWTSSAISALGRAQANWAGGEQFEVQLFRIDANLIRADDRANSRFTLERLGWRAIAARPGSTEARPYDPKEG
jgi:prepilin-type N-terminal cleavage/methylation domain-containing protein